MLSFHTAVIHELPSAFDSSASPIAIFLAKLRSHDIFYKAKYK